MGVGRIICAMGLCLGILGCSKEGGEAKVETEPAKSGQHPLDGVWDFVTSVNWTETGTAYIRGTLYVKTENGQTVCSLTAFQEEETRNLFIEALSEKTTSTEQDCQIFVNEGEFSIKSRVQRGGENYVPDDFSLKQQNKNLLEGRLVSSINLDATFIRRGSGLQLATPWRMAERDRADKLIGPFVPLTHGKTGCVFGISSVVREGNAEDGIRFDLRRLCRSNERYVRLNDAGNYAEMRQGYYVSCAKKTAYENWQTLYRENGTPLKTTYAGEDGKRATVVGQTPPKTGEGEPVKRIAGVNMAAKGFSGDPIEPNTVLGLVAQQHCQ